MADARVLAVPHRLHGDLIWAAADQRSRGFLIGATAGRTTLGGEGLQHQDGGSLVQAAMVPNCRAYDPCFSGELAVILDHGMREMLEQQRDVFYYITVMNESYGQPTLAESVKGDVIQGMYKFAEHKAVGGRPLVRLIGSGAILREVIGAAQLLTQDWHVDTEIWSASSFSELARDAREVERWNRLHPTEPAQVSHVASCLAGHAPVVAATDYVRAWPELITPHVDAPVMALGTDGSGRSDTRAALRQFFEVDRHQIVLAALTALHRQGQLDAATCAQAIERYEIDTDRPSSWSC